MNQNQADSNIYAGTTDSAIDLRELIYEYALNQSSHFRANPAIKNSWPAPYTYLVITSTAQDPVDVSGRYHHYIQATGINVTSGDVLTVKASIDGNTYYTVNTFPINTATSAATITTDGLYYVNGNFWYLEVSVAAGSNTGATNVFLNSRPD